MKRLSVAASLLLILVCATALAGIDYVFRTDPAVASASVFVDGTFAGTTDDSGKLVLSGTSPGRHLLRVEAGGESYTSEVPFDAELNALPAFRIGEATRQRKPLQPAAVDYRIDANVSDAEVSIDGAPGGVTDSAGRVAVHLTPGKPHTIEVRKTGFASHAETITPTAPGELKVILQAHAEPPRRRIDVLLVVLVALLIGSLILLVRMFMRHRARTAASSIPVVRTNAVAEQNAGHFDRYRLLSTLGSGGVATIYRAYDLIDKSTIALKVLDLRWLSDPDMVRKFLAEGEALRSITQRDAAAAVVKCFRYGREHESIIGRPFIALELLEGETLQSRLEREAVLDPLTAAAIGYQIASALVPVHGAGIVHRDLTPDNVFLRKGDLVVSGARFTVPLVVLIDFGIARQELMSRMTLDGSIAGKPHYMSPEQCRGLPVDTRADLYSLGIILYRIAAGRLPFAGRDPFEVMRAQMSDIPPHLGGQVDKRYADICERLLRKEAGDRPQSAAAVAHDIEELLLSIGASPSMNVVSFPTRRISL